MLSFGTSADRTLLVYSMWWNIRGPDKLNEPNAMEIVRMSDRGSGGALGELKALETGQPNSGISANQIDSSDWTTPPVVTDVIGGARPFNLARGWQWSAHPQGQPIVVQPAGGGDNLGFRILSATSGPVTFDLGAIFLAVGVP
jgi:hypothetical protein